MFKIKINDEEFYIVPARGRSKSYPDEFWEYLLQKSKTERLKDRLRKIKPLRTR